MAEGHYVTSTRYKKVCVLLLSWAEGFDDLLVHGEVKELGEVFKHTYNFDVESKHIKEDPDKKAQAQVNSIVANWVLEKDTPKSLCIVYFAGHGRPGTIPGHLKIKGQTRPTIAMRDHLNTVIWNKTEALLQDTHADVLQIFDCCYAGSLGQAQGGARTIEYLAATSGPTTKAPGSHFFTTALIWALRELKSERFTTLHLLHKVREAPDFPEAQRPILQSRNNNNSGELIMLESLADDRDLSSELDTSKGATGKEILTLKFILETKPSPGAITAFGKDLNTIAAKADLIINRIMWGGLQAKQADMVFKAAHKFMESIRQRQSSNVESSQRPEDETVVGLMHEIQDTVISTVERDLSGNFRV